MSILTVKKLPKTSTLVIQQRKGRDFFVSSDNVIVISIQSLTFLISFLIKNGYISKKTLEGILSEISE